MRAHWKRYGRFNLRANMSAGRAQNTGHFEFDVFNSSFHSIDCDRVAAGEGIDDFVDQLFWCRGSGGDTNRADTFQGAPIDLGGALHQLGIGAAGAGGHFDEAFGVGRVGGANNQERVA